MRPQLFQAFMPFHAAQMGAPPVYPGHFNRYSSTILNEGQAALPFSFMNAPPVIFFQGDRDIVMEDAADDMDVDPPMFSPSCAFSHPEPMDVDTPVHPFYENDQPMDVDVSPAVLEIATFLQALTLSDRPGSMLSDPDIDSHPDGMEVVLYKRREPLPWEGADVQFSRLSLLDSPSSIEELDPVDPHPHPDDMALVLYKPRDLLPCDGADDFSRFSLLDPPSTINDSTVTDLPEVVNDGCDLDSLEQLVERFRRLTINGDDDGPEDLDAAPSFSIPTIIDSAREDADLDPTSPLDELNLESQFDEFNLSALDDYFIPCPLVSLANITARGDLKAELEARKLDFVAEELIQIPVLTDTASESTIPASILDRSIDTAPTDSPHPSPPHSDMPIPLTPPSSKWIRTNENLPRPLGRFHSGVYATPPSSQSPRARKTDHPYRRPRSFKTIQRDDFSEDPTADAHSNSPNPSHSPSAKATNTEPDSRRDLKAEVKARKLDCLAEPIQIPVLTDTASESTIHASISDHSTETTFTDSPHPSPPHRDIPIPCTLYTPLTSKRIRTNENLPHTLGRFHSGVYATPPSSQSPRARKTAHPYRRPQSFKTTQMHDFSEDPTTEAHSSSPNPSHTPSAKTSNIEPERDLVAPGGYPMDGFEDYYLSLPAFSPSSPKYYRSFSQWTLELLFGW